MSRRQGARTGLAKPRETERELLEARWRERRKAEGPSASAAIPSMLPDGQVEAVANPTVQLLRRLHLVMGKESFRQAADDLVALGLDGDDMGQRLDEMETGFDGDDDFIASLVQFVMKEQPDVSELQAIEEIAAMNVVPASSFAGAVQRIKRAVYSRRP